MSLSSDVVYVGMSFFKQYGLRDLLYSQKIAILQELDALIRFRVDEALKGQEKKVFSPDAMIAHIRMQTIHEVLQQWQRMNT